MEDVAQWLKGAAAGLFAVATNDEGGATVVEEGGSGFPYNLLVTTDDTVEPVRVLRIKSTDGLYALGDGKESFNELSALVAHYMEAAPIVTSADVAPVLLSGAAQQPTDAVLARRATRLARRTIAAELVSQRCATSVCWRACARP